MSDVPDARLMTKGICHTCGSHLVEVSDEPTRGCGNRTSVRDTFRCVSNKLTMGSTACGKRFRRVLVVLLVVLAVCWHMSVHLSPPDLEDLGRVIHYQCIKDSSTCWCRCDCMKSPLAIWNVVVCRVGDVDRDISTVAKNAYQWVTSASSRWSWMPFAVMWYWLCTCDAACTVCSPDQSTNGGRRVHAVARLKDELLFKEGIDQQRSASDQQ